MLNLVQKREALEDNSIAGLEAIGFDIKSSAYQPNVYNLAIKGFLAPGWTGRLTAGLAQHRIGIVRGQAEKVTSSAWHSTFELKSAHITANPLGINYVTLANTELPYDRTSDKIALRDFLMEPCGRHEGSLYLEVRGVDRLGFLGDMLDYFSMRCLFPVKMTVETVADTAVDCFWLRGIGGSRPSESVAVAMKENLELLLVGNA
jgi:hypothetical protein